MMHGQQNINFKQSKKLCHYFKCVNCVFMPLDLTCYNLSLALILLRAQNSLCSKDGLLTATVRKFSRVKANVRNLKTPIGLLAKS
jgi:hypothetical protein